jgi:hypothetical protein
VPLAVLPFHAVQPISCATLYNHDDSGTSAVGSQSSIMQGTTMYTRLPCDLWPIKGLCYAMSQSCLSETLSIACSRYKAERLCQTQNKPTLGIKDPDTFEVSVNTIELDVSCVTGKMSSGSKHPSCKSCGLPRSNAKMLILRPQCSILCATSSGIRTAYHGNT